MIRERALRKREKLLGKLPVTGELLRGSLLERKRASHPTLLMAQVRFT
jgi:hypothetical protein